MKLLVTGGMGFIGSTFIRHIIENYKDYKIYNLDALTYAANSENLDDIKDNKNYTFVHGNICDKKIVCELLPEVDCIINFAAETHVDRSILNPELFVRTNIEGTYNLLQASKEYGIKRFIQISTDEVYGSINEGYFYETSPLSPNSPYSASKAGADLMAKSYFETYKLPVIITRCSNNFGPYQYPEKLIPFFISKLFKNEKVPIYGDGMNVRDWIYVSDHVSAIDKVLHHGVEGEIYNISGNNEKTNLEITKIILNFLGKDETSIEYVKDRLGHDRRYSLCSDKIRSQLNWEPSVSFEEGIKLTIEWYLENPSRLKSTEEKERELYV